MTQDLTLRQIKEEKVKMTESIRKTIESFQEKTKVELTNVNVEFTRGNIKVNTSFKNPLNY